MIKQKGTTNAIDRLLRSTTVSTDQTLIRMKNGHLKLVSLTQQTLIQQLELRLKAQDIILL